jgi:nitrogen fixation NifU-like protein
MQNESLNFWQQHSLQFLEMAFRSDKQETLKNPDGYGKQSSACGDTVEIFLEITGGRIRVATFATNGCLNAVACANALLHLVQGKSLQAAREVTAEDVVDYLETLPTEEHHCAAMAVEALTLALASVPAAS